MTTTTALIQDGELVTMGNGTAVHVFDYAGAKCNAWGLTGERPQRPRIARGATAPTCKKCIKIIAAK